MKNATGISKLLGKTSFAMVLALGAFALLPATPVRAQDATLPTKEVNITLNDAPVRDALKTLFDSVGLSYNIDQSVTGLVTVDLRAIPFDVALRSILRSSDPPLSYTVDDGVYDVHPRQQTIELSGVGTQAVGSAAAPTDSSTASTEDTTTQVIQLKLNYASAYLLMSRAFPGTGASSSGVIPTLVNVQSSNNGGGGGMGGMSGGMGGMSGGMGGMSGGMGGMSGGMGGMSGGMGGMSGGMGGMSGGMGGVSTSY